MACGAAPACLLPACRPFTLPRRVASTSSAPPAAAAASATCRFSRTVLKDQLLLWPSVDLK